MPFYLQPSGLLTWSDPSHLKPGEGGFKPYGVNRSRRTVFYSRCAVLWYYFQPLNFFTFTLPQQTQDDKFYSGKFSMLLENCRKNHNVRSYVWVAEAQKRGAIHYHMVTHKHLPITWLNNYWMDLVGQKSKNAVDVQHVPKSIKSLPLYMAKYFSKGSVRPIQGRSFGTTQDLKLPPIVLESPPADPYRVLTRIIDGVEIVSRYYPTERVMSDFYQA